MPDIELHSDKYKNLLASHAIMGEKTKVQNQTSQSLDSKIGVLLGFCAAILTGFVAILVTKASLLGLNFFTLGVVCVLTSFLLLVLAARTRTYYDYPLIESLQTEVVVELSSNDFLEGIIDSSIECYAYNASVNVKKAQLYDGAIWTMLVGVFFVFLGII